ncbi:MAG: trigger factor [Candidatus Gottesmanbacteria bacterium]
MTVAVNKLANGTIELTITTPWTDIQSNYEQVINEYVNEAELPGFRKGKAPRNLVIEKLDKNKVYEEVLKRIVPKYYSEAIKQESITPVIPPKIEVINFKENDVCQFKALTCEKPLVKLGDYQKGIIELKKNKANKIWVPGDEQKEKPDDQAGKPAALPLEEIIKVLLETCQVNIPEILIDDEINRMLSRLIDQTQKLGLTIEQYLSSQGKTSDIIRHEYHDQAIKSLSLEFILEAIADHEKIEVSDEEINKLIEQTKDEKEKEALKSQKYYLAAILRQQKTLNQIQSTQTTVVT